LRRIGNAGGPWVRTNPIASLAELLGDETLQLQGAIALIDSPRWPSDLDWSKQPEIVPTGDSRHGREIDAGLRALVFTLRKGGTAFRQSYLSMFPTPPMRYFGAHLNLSDCKSHLRTLGRALFAEALNRKYGAASGGIFTRFMIAGFATYQALQTICAETYECYPDLQFRLWCGRQQLFSKNSSSGRKAALASRIRVLSALARKLGVSGTNQIQRMDEADAAILAMSVAAARCYGATLILANAWEGSFMVALDEPEAEHLQWGHRGFLELANL
jgi:hypothetical protein